MQQINPEPIWDEGISSLLYGEYERMQVPLTIEDLRGFANEHAIRVGDILETLFLMAIYGEWQYTDAKGNHQVLDEGALDELYAKGRITDNDLDAFQGLWQPTAS